MRREGYFKKRKISPDPKYGRVDVARFINYLMGKGKKNTAEKVFYDTMDFIKEKTKKDPMDIFEKAIENASPVYEVVSRRIGGANYQIPREVRPNRRYFMASNWIIGVARNKKGVPMYRRLADELMSASNNEGEAIKKKQNTHRMAEANRAFASLLRR